VIRVNGGVRRVGRGAMNDHDEIEALRKALAAEHAAVYAYAVIGARTEGALQAGLRAAFDAHRGRRDQLRSLIVNRGGRPSEPESSYTLPSTPRSAQDAVALAVQLESGIPATYLEVCAAPSAALRRMAALAMQESAVRSYGFQPALTAFPGMPVAASAATPGTATPPPTAEGG